MPLTKLHVPDHLNPATVRALAQAVQASLVRHCGVPADDCFQIVHRLPAGSLHLDPQFPGVQRSADACIVEIAFLQGRSDDQKRALFHGIAEGAHGLRPDDVFVALLENTRMDWSLGRGQAYADVGH